MRQWPALTPPCPLSRGVEPCRVSLALRRCAPGSSRARPPPHMADKICRASRGSVSVQTAGWRSCVEPHSHALASHICGTRWSSWGVFLASGYFSWACSLSVDHLSFCPLCVSAQPVALFGVLGTSVQLSDAFHHGSTTAGTPYTTNCAMALFTSLGPSADCRDGHKSPNIQCERVTPHGRFFGFVAWFLTELWFTG